MVDWLRRCRQWQWCRARSRCSGTNDLELSHHSVVFVLNDMTMEHVHACVIGELQLELERLPGINVPGLLHRLVGVTCSSISTDALLSNVVNVYGVRLSCRVGKDPLLSSSKNRLGVDSVGIKPQPIDRPVACSLVKAPIARHRGFSNIWQGAQGWRN